MKFKRLRTRGYPKAIIKDLFNFASRSFVLTKKKKANERILPFATTLATTYHPAVSNLKHALMEQ